MIGEETNIGDGVTTSDFDGFEKYPTTIGARCFFGTCVDIIAPATIGEESFIASRTRLSTKAQIPPHSFVFEETRNKRTRIVWKENCSFKLPGYWKWIWTQKPVSPILMQELFDTLQSRFENYTQWLNTPQPELSEDKPRNLIKKRGEGGVEEVKNLTEETPLLQLISV